MEDKLLRQMTPQLRNFQDERETNLRGGVGNEAVGNQVLWSLSQNGGLSSLEQLETPGELSVDSFLSA